MKDKSDLKKSSFPTPAIASSTQASPSADLENVDLSRNGAQGDVVVTKGRAATFVSGVSKAKRPD